MCRRNSPPRPARAPSRSRSSASAARRPSSPSRCSIPKGARCGCRAAALASGASGLSPRRHARQPLDDLDQLAMRGAGRIAELIDRMLVGEAAEAQKLARALPAVQLQVRRPRSEEEPAHLAAAEELAELRGRHIHEEEDENPERYGDEPAPGEPGDQIGKEVPE